MKFQIFFKQNFFFLLKKKLSRTYDAVLPSYIIIL